AGADGAARGRAGDPGGLGGERVDAAADAAGGEPGAVRRRGAAWSAAGAADGLGAGEVRVPILDPGARPDDGFEHRVGRGGTGAGGGGAAGVRAAAAGAGVGEGR